MASCVPRCRAALSRESTLRCGEGHIEGMRGIRLKEVFAVALRGEQLRVLDESPESSSVDRKTTRRECDALECAAPLLCANARVNSCSSRFARNAPAVHCDRLYARGTARTGTPGRWQGWHCAGPRLVGRARRQAVVRTKRACAAPYCKRAAHTVRVALRGECSRPTPWHMEGIARCDRVIL